MRYLKRKVVDNAGCPRGFWGRLTVRKMNKSHDGLTDWGLSFLGINGEDDILDIGCGGGRTLKKLAYATSHTVWGVDYAAASVAESFRFNRKAVRDGQVMICEASVAELPFEDQAFDVITAVETIYFWPAPAENLKEVYRVLKDGGRLMILTEGRADGPEPEKWEEIIDRIDLKLPAADDLALLLKGAGFRSITAHIKGEALCVIAEK